MNRAKIILIAIASVFVVALGVLGFIVNGKYSAASKAQRSRDSKEKALKDVYNQEIFPSKDNVKVLQDNLAELESARAMLRTQLETFNVAAPTNASSPVFVRKLRDLVENKIKKAPLVEGKKCVAGNFTFGFERYLGESPDMPTEAQVPRLFQQLIIVSKLTDVMFDAGVIQIKSIQREAFDGGSTSSPRDDDEGGRRGRRRRSSSDDEESVSAVVVDGYSIDEKLYNAQHFTFKVVARQNSMMDVLNRIASLDMFAVVTDIKIHKSGNELRVPGTTGSGEDKKENSRSRSSSRTKSESVQQAEAEPTISDLPAGQRLVSGPEIDAPLEVTIDIDVYGFKKEAE